MAIGAGESTEPSAGPPRGEERRSCHVVVHFKLLSVARSDAQTARWLELFRVSATVKPGSVLL